MDMPEVKAFNAELSGLYDNKPPISKAKMSAITKGAIKAIKVYKHVVHSVEKFIQKCKPEYKVPGLYVIDSIVRQSRHQFGQDKDVFAPRFAKNMQQTFANLFRCPPEDKRNIIRVLNLWQKNNVFSPQVIQPLMDMADPSHPLHQEIQQQLNNTANGSSLNLSHNTSEKMSPGPAQHSPHMSSPMGGDQFQDEPSGPNLKFNRKLLNDFEYDSEDEQMMDAVPLPPHSSHSHTSHSASHTTHTSSMSHGQSQQQVNQNPTDAMASILTNPEIMRQLHSLQAQMQMMTSIQLPNLMPMMSDMQQMQQNQNQQNLPFLSSQDLQKQNDGKDDMGNNESDIEFVDSGPTVIEIPDANDSRSPSPKSRRHRSRSKSPKRRRRGSRSRSRSPRRRRDRDRERDREREKEREKDREKNYKEREAEREKQKEREKKGLPPIKKENLSVCSTTLWVGHLSKLATPEELSDLFGGVGGVVSIDVVAPRGCAFVVMERRRDAYKALQKLNKHKLHSKEITVAWAPGKGVKGRDWKDYWEAELGVSYLPWAALHARWLLGALSLDAFEDGGACDEDSLPPWLPPRILPKTMMDNMSMMSVGMLPLPPSVPPPLRAQVPPDLSGGAISSPLSGANIPMPPTSMPSMPTMPNMSNMPNMASMPNMSNMGMPRMPPPGMPAGMPTGIPTGMPTGMPAGMTAGMPAGMTASMPPGIRPPSLPSGVPGLQNDAGIPTGGPMIRFPPGMPPQSMPQPGLVPGFLGGLLGVGGLLGGVPVLHLPPRLPQRSNETNQSDDAMDLDTEDMAHPEENNSSNGNDNTPSLPALLPDQMNIKETQRERLIEQIQALLSKPPPAFNASEPPPGFNASEPPPFGQPLPGEDKQDEERKDRDRERRERERDRGDRRERDRGRDRERDNRRERDRGNERGLRGEREREGRDERRDRADRGPAERDRPGRRDRDRGERDRERERFGPNRDNTTRTSREKSPRQASNADNPEKSLQERLWEMANGKAAAARPDAEPERPRAARAAAAAAGPAADGPAEAPRAPLLGAPFRAELRLRMRGPPRPPTAGWMDGPPGPPFGPRFNGMGPPFNRPPFERPPFDGPMYDGPPRFERPPFNRMPFDMNRPPFDGPRPPFDGPRPLFDGPRPPFDGPRPPYDGPRPPFDGPRPPFDGPRPPFDGPRQFDGDRPFDGPPRFDGPPEFFDRNNRRFEEREPPFDERGWSGERDWPERRRERRPRDDEQRFNRPDRRRNFDERPRNDRSDERQRDDKPREEKPKEEKQREDKPREEKQREDKPREEKQREEKPSDDKPREERASRRDKDRKSRWGAAEERAADDPTSAELGADGGAALIAAESQLDAEMRPDEEIDERLDSNVDEPCAPEPGHAVPAPTADEIPFPPEFRDESPSPPEFRDENPFPSEARDENPFTPESRDENPSSHESRDENPFTPESRDENPFPSESRDEIPFSSESRGEISSPVESREESPRPSERDSSERSEPGEEPSYAAAIESEPVAKPAIEPMAGLYDTGDAIDTSFGAKAPSEAPEEKAPSTERAPTPPATGSDDIFSQSGEASSVAAPEPREGPA